MCTHLFYIFFTVWHATSTNSSATISTLEAFSLSLRVSCFITTAIRLKRVALRISLSTFDIYILVVIITIVIIERSLRTISWNVPKFTTPITICNRICNRRYICFYKFRNRISPCAGGCIAHHTIHHYHMYWYTNRPLETLSILPLDWTLKIKVKTLSEGLNWLLTTCWRFCAFIQDSLYK